MEAVRRQMQVWERRKIKRAECKGLLLMRQVWVKGRGMQIVGSERVVLVVVVVEVGGWSDCPSNLARVLSLAVFRWSHTCTLE